MNKFLVLFVALFGLINCGVTLDTDENYSNNVKEKTAEFSYSDLQKLLDEAKKVDKLLDEAKKVESSQSGDDKIPSYYSPNLFKYEEQKFPKPIDFAHLPDLTQYKIPEISLDLPTSAPKMSKIDKLNLRRAFMFSLVLRVVGIVAAVVIVFIVRCVVTKVRARRQSEPHAKLITNNAEV